VPIIRAGETIEIGDIEYIALTSSLSPWVLPYQWSYILNIIHKQTTQWKEKNIINQWALSWSIFLDLYNLQEVKRLYKQIYILLEDHTIEIGWRKYIWIGDKVGNVYWIPIKKLKKAISSMSEKHKKENILPNSWKPLSWGIPVDLCDYEVFLGLVEQLKTRKLSWEWTILIDDKLCSVVTYRMNEKNSLLPCSWKVMMKIINQQSDEWITENVIKDSWRKGNLYTLDALLEIYWRKTEEST
jgi:hypothetical protein